jgi:hypothetical protein
MDVTTIAKMAVGIAIAPPREAHRPPKGHSACPVAVPILPIVPPHAQRAPRR